METENARETDHADARAHPATAHAETNTKGTHTRRAATTESAREKTDMLEDVEVVVSGIEETVALTDEETVATILAVAESAATVVTCSTTAEEVVEEVAIVPLSNPSTRSAAPVLPESPRSLPLI